VGSNPTLSAILFGASRFPPNCAGPVLDLARGTRSSCRTARMRSPAASSPTTSSEKQRLAHFGPSGVSRLNPVDEF
jgi:hypothetical protein